MSLVSVVSYYASDSQDAIDKIKDTLVSAGWTLHDTIASPYGYVLYSTGESGLEMPCYVGIRNDTNVIEVFCWAGWNNSTHAGTIYFGNDSYSHIDANDSAAIYLWVSATKDGFGIVSLVATEYDFLGVGIFVPLYEPGKGTLASGVSSGSSVTITLGSGEADGFRVGEAYKIFNEAHREVTNITAVNSGSNQITVDSLTYSYVAGDQIGYYPFRWYMILSDYSYTYLFDWDNNGTGSNTSYCSQLNLISMTQADPCNASNNRYALSPNLVPGGPASLGGVAIKEIPFMRMQAGATPEQTISINEFDEGTSSGSNTSTTLNDTTKSWTTDEYIGSVLIITAGTGAGQFRAITDNDSTSLTVAAWTTIPDATSEYTICEEGWLYHYCNAAVANSYGIRIL